MINHSKCCNQHQKVLFFFNILSYGILLDPEIFQRVMKNLLQDIPGVVVNLYDIMVTGVLSDEHLHGLEKVLSRLEGAGL